MRAALLEKNQQPLTIVDDIKIESPGSREVVVRVTHCGICHSDLTMIDSGGGAQLPLVLGHEAAGIVEEVGSAVTRLRKGDKVMLTPIPSCGACYYCVRGQSSLCVDGQNFMTGLRKDGTSPCLGTASASSRASVSGAGATTRSSTRAAPSRSTTTRRSRSPA